jgi:hypothetical protein
MTGFAAWARGGCRGRAGHVGDDAWFPKTLLSLR